MRFLYFFFFFCALIQPTWLQSYSYNEDGFLKKLSQQQNLSKKVKYIHHFLNDIDSQLKHLSFSGAKKLSKRKIVVEEIVYLDLLRDKLEVLTVHRSCRSKELFLKSYLTDPYTGRFINTKSSLIAIRALKYVCPKSKLKEWVPIEVQEILSQ